MQNSQPTQHPQPIQQPEQQPQPSQPMPQEQQQLNEETLQKFNQICIDATKLMEEYKTQSVALKYEIADMVSIYQKSSQGNTEAVPVEKIIAITNEYENGMREANREYTHLAEQLRKEETERDQIMEQIKDCFTKLERMEVKIKEKKRRELEQRESLKKEEAQKGNTQEKKEQKQQISSQKQLITPPKAQQQQVTITPNLSLPQIQQDQGLK